MKTCSKAARRPAIAFFFFTLAAGLILAGCRDHGLNVKVYYLSNRDGGLVRKQENEVVRFQDAEGYRCMNRQDFDTVVQFVRSCVEAKP